MQQVQIKKNKKFHLETYTILINAKAQRRKEGKEKQFNHRDHREHREGIITRYKDGQNNEFNFLFNNFR